MTAFAELRASDAWIKHLPPTVPVRAGYLTLRNPLARAVTVVEVSSPAFTRIEIHRTIERGGMMGMERLSRLRIPAHSSLRLAPGGLHLMMTAAEPTAPETQIPLTLTLDDGSKLEVEMTVRK